MSDEMKTEWIFRSITFLALIFIGWQLLLADSSLDRIQLRVERNYDTIQTSGARTEKYWEVVNTLIHDIETRMARVEKALSDNKK